MQTKRNFCVQVLGLSEREITVLKSVEHASTTRVRAYTFVVSLDPIPDCEIYLVDGDNPAAMDAWGRCRKLRPAPAVLISAAGQALFGQRGLKRPLIVSKLMHALDEVTTEDLHFMPEVNIGQDVVVDPAKISVKPPSGESYVALVVDDSPTVRKQIELGLRRFDCVADCVETGEEALERLATRSYDLIFLDVVLPGADGYQVCKSIKRDKATKDTTVIMLTGKTSPFDQIKGKLAGCDSYLTKPVEMELFQETVQRFLEKLAPHAAHGGEMERR